MIVSLPMFPLQVVVFPDEQVPLHIFEERYKQLINDCENEGITFGIPTFLDGKLEYGTEIKLERVANRHPNGSLDVLCSGLRAFRIEEFYNPFPDKLYAGADVVFRAEMGDAANELRFEAFTLVQKLFELLGTKTYEWFEGFTSYTFAHVIGLSVKQEYHVLTLPTEGDRLHYIVSHLNTTIPVVKEMNRTQKRIAMNGHFRNYDPLDFEDYTLGS